MIYPGLKTHPLNERAYESLSPHAKEWVDDLGERDANGGFPYGGMVSFRILPSKEDGTTDATEGTADTFLAKLRLFALAESLGGVESLAELPSRMTHGSIPPAERAVLGIGDDLIRLSCGVEDAQDLLHDVEQALVAAVHGAVKNEKVSEKADGGIQTPPDDD